MKRYFLAFSVGNANIILSMDKPGKMCYDFAKIIDMIIVPLSSKKHDEAIEVMRDALGYGKSAAEEEVRRMLSSKRVGFAVIADNRVIGIFGTIPRSVSDGSGILHILHMQRKDHLKNGRLYLWHLQMEIVLFAAKRQLRSRFRNHKNVT